MSTDVEVNAVDLFDDDLSNALDSAEVLGDFKGMPPGDYEATFDGIEQGITERGGKWINLCCTLVGGKDATDEVIGGSHSDHYNLNTEGNLNVFRTAMSRLGINTTNAQEIRDELDALVGTRWKITIIEKNGFTNTYWNKRID